eukprot:14867035-Heterocapsa_arctica.AAC.1
MAGRAELPFAWRRRPRAQLRAAGLASRLEPKQTSALDQQTIQLYTMYTKTYRHTGSLRYITKNHPTHQS